MANEDHARPLDRQAFGILAAITLLAAALRLWALGRPSLWLDELVTLWASSPASAAEVLGRVGSCMATPPLPFLVHHAVLGIVPASEWALRLPSALAGIVTVPIVFFAARRMFGLPAAVVAAAVLAVHPLHLSASMDARPYALAVLWAAGSVWAFADWLTRGGSRAAVAWVLCSAGLVHTQFVFAGFVAAQVVAYWLVRRLRKETALGLLAPAGAIALLCAPLGPQMASVLLRRHALAWRIEGGFASEAARLLALKPLLFAGAAAVTVTAWRALRSRSPWSFSARAVSTPPVHVTVLSICTLLPMLAMGIASSLSGMGSLSLVRYMMASLAPAGCLIGWLLTRPARRLDRCLYAAVFLGAILATRIVPQLAYGRPFNESLGAQDWRGAGRFLDANLRDGDLVLLRSGLVESNAYSEGDFPDTCGGYLAAPLPPLYIAQRLDPVILPATWPASLHPASFDSRVGERLQGHGRMWLVLAAPPDSEAYLASLLGYLQAEQRARLSIIQSQIFGQILVALVVPVAPSSR